jgi:hypothetical protein
VKKVALSTLFVLVTGAMGALHASFVFTLSQVGPNVVVTGAGTLNLSALSAGSIGQIGSFIQPNTGYLAVGGSTTEYGLGGDPMAFGAGNFTFPTSAIGDVVGVQGDPGFQSSPRIFVPLGYISGSALSNSMTFNNATFSSLGFTPGTYTFSWGTGATADSFTVTSVVPEGCVSALLGIGLAGLFAAHWLASFRHRRSL